MFYSGYSTMTHMLRFSSYIAKIKIVSYRNNKNSRLKLKPIPLPIAAKEHVPSSPGMSDCLYSKQISSFKG